MPVSISTRKIDSRRIWNGNGGESQYVSIRLVTISLSPINKKKKKKKKKKINPGRISIEPTKKIIQSPGEFDTSRIAIFNSAIHSTCTALNFADSCRWSRCKTAKYRKPRHPAETRQRGKSGTEPRKRAETRYFKWKWLPLLAYRTHEIVV